MWDSGAWLLVMRRGLRVRVWLESMANTQGVLVAVQGTDRSTPLDLVVALAAVRELVAHVRHAMGVGCA